mmetsp:Transcript_126880/g.359037  ORF Transcript_126880/g.359037 Transcript_126880/m.359037 type:complete len:201 (-) Transcript_126880:601-1203(-)
MHQGHTRRPLRPQPADGGGPRPDRRGGRQERAAVEVRTLQVREEPAGGTEEPRQSGHDGGPCGPRRGKDHAHLVAEARPGRIQDRVPARDRAPLARHGADHDAQRHAIRVRVRPHRCLQGRQRDLLRDFPGDGGRPLLVEQPGPKAGAGAGGCYQGHHDPDLLCSEASARGRHRAPGLVPRKHIADRHRRRGDACQDHRL